MAGGGIKIIKKSTDTIQYGILIAVSISGFISKFSSRLSFLSPPHFASLACFLSSDGDDIPFFILEDHYITRDRFACIHISEDGLVEGIDPVFFFFF